MSAEWFFRAVFVLLSCVCVPLEGKQVTVNLQNGGSMSGSLQVEPDGRLQLKSYWMERPLAFEVEDVRHLSLHASPVKNAQGVQVKGKGGTRMWLQNLSVSASGIEGEAHWGERVSFVAEDLEQVFLSPVNQAVLREKESDDTVPVRGLGREVELALGSMRVARRLYDVQEWPEQFYLEVELKDTGTAPNYQLVCSGPFPQQDSRFMVRVTPNVVRVLVTEPDGVTPQRPRYINVPLLPGQSFNRIRIMGDLVSGDIRLRVGEGEVVTWTMEGENLFQSAIDRPASILLQDVRTGEPVEIDTVSLVPWGGAAFPELPMSVPGVTLFSGEIIPGEVVELENGTVSFRSAESGGLLNLDRETVWVWTPSETDAVPKSSPFAVVDSRVIGERYAFNELRLTGSPDPENVRMSGVLASGTRIEIPLRGIQSFVVKSTLSRLHSPSQNDARDVSVTLLNGDRLQGYFKGIDGPNVLIRPGLKDVDVLPVSGRAVKRLQFVPQTSLQETGFQFWLTDGGRLAGELLSLSGPHLVARTRWADPLILSRHSVRRVQKRPEGYTSISLLTPDFERWTYDGTSYQALADRPDVVQRRLIGWILESGEYFHTTPPFSADQMELEIHMDPQDIYASGQMILDIRGLHDADGQERQINLRFDGRRLLAGVYAQGQLLQRWSGFMSPNTNKILRIILKINQHAEMLRLDVGDQYTWEYSIPEWTFSPEPLPARISLVLSDDIEQLFLRRLRLISAPPQPVPEVTTGDKEPNTIMFNNGDRMNAAVMSVEDNVARLVLDNGSEVPMPLSRIFHFSMPETEPFQLRRKAAHARFLLNDGEEEFIAEVLGADQNRFVLRREGVEGVFRIPVDQISMVELNPYFLR